MRRLKRDLKRLTARSERFGLNQRDRHRPLRRDLPSMRMRGLEPPPGCPDTDLNRARLPIPPHPRGGSEDIAPGDGALAGTAERRREPGYLAGGRRPGPPAAGWIPVATSASVDPRPKRAAIV